MYNKFGVQSGNALQQQKLRDSIDEIQKLQSKLERDYLYNNHLPIFKQENQEEKSYNNNLSEYKQKYGNYDQSFLEYQPKFSDKRMLEYRVPFVGSTTYNEHYTQPKTDVSKILNPQLQYQGLLRPIPPSYPQYSRIKFEGESTYKASYGDLEGMGPIRLINSQKINRKQLQDPTIGKFYGSTSYKDSYTPFRFELRKDRTLVARLPKDLKFQGDSTYHSDYKNFKVEKIKQAKCDIEYLPVPYKNNLNNKDHIRYDAFSNKFV